VITLIQLKKAPKNLENKVKVQLLSDVVILTLLFQVTGGAANPFVSILLFPLVISTSILRGRFNWFMVMFTLTCYGSLFFLEGINMYDGGAQPDTGVMQHSMSDHAHHMASSAENAFSLHIIGMWFNFAISAVLISFFVVRMRQEIEQQQLQLNTQREQALRDEQILGIATQAASAAHHLGTPLSTMSVIIHDLQNEAGFPAQYKDDLLVLAAQVANCKQVLHMLRQDAGNEFQPELLSVFIGKLLDEFQLIRPQVVLEKKGLDNLNNQASIISDPALRMAILNVLNNAADVSPHKIIFSAQCQQDSLVIDIIDFGEGVYEGKGLSSVRSSKQDGLGIGLLLSHATLNRYGGEISLFNLGKGGTQVRIKIPFLT
jgi:two-component system sensor histidine kinase RegB